MSAPLATTILSGLRDLVAEYRYSTKRHKPAPRWLESSWPQSDLPRQGQIGLPALPASTPPATTSSLATKPSTTSAGLADVGATRAIVGRGAEVQTTRITYSNDDLIRAIRRVANELGGVPSSTKYQRSARSLGLPSVPTITNRFGTWTAAVRAAGMTPNTGNATYHQRWSPDACWRALTNLTAELGAPPTMDQYELLAAGNDDLPSPMTVRNRLGLWSSVAARLRSANTHLTLGRIGVARDATPQQRDEQILLAHLADEITDQELAGLIRDGLFAWRPGYGEAPSSLRMQG